MYFHNLESFIHMGGYASFVWPSYFITLTVVSLNLLIPYLNKRRLLKEIRKKNDKLSANL